jgi:hypothetical protein
MGYLANKIYTRNSFFRNKIGNRVKPKFSNRAGFALLADENPVLSGLTLTKPPYIGGFRHFAIENLV